MIAPRRTGGDPADAAKGKVAVQVVKVKRITQISHDVKRAGSIGHAGIERDAVDAGVAPRAFVRGAGVIIARAQSKDQIIPETVVRPGRKAENGKTIAREVRRGVLAAERGDKVRKDPPGAGPMGLERTTARHAGEVGAVVGQHQAGQAVV